MFALQVDSEVAIGLLQTHHAETIFAKVDENRTHLRTWLPWVDPTKNPEAVRTFIERSLQDFAQHSNPACGIWYQGEFVGGIGMHTIDRKNHATSLGYWLAASHQGKGIVTRACMGMIDYAFHDLNLNRIVIEAAVNNHKSRAIPQRLGFTEEGTLRQSRYLYDRYVDMVQYGLLAEEWTK